MSVVFSGYRYTVTKSREISPLKILTYSCHVSSTLATTVCALTAFCCPDSSLITSVYPVRLFPATV